MPQPDDQAHMGLGFVRHLLKAAEELVLPSGGYMLI